MWEYGSVLIARYSSSRQERKGVQRATIHLCEHRETACRAIQMCDVISVLLVDWCLVVTPVIQMLKAGPRLDELQSERRSLNGAVVRPALRPAK
jgi:hypothetical protein